MSWVHVTILVAACAVFGAIVLALLWPSRSKAERVLVRWGVADPTDAEITGAVTYLKRRRLCYPWTFLAVAAVSSVIGLDDGDGLVSRILVTLVLGALLAELWAQRPTRDLPRSAVLAPRRLLDLVPRWSLVALAVLVTVSLVTQIAALAGAAWAVSGSSVAPGWVLAATLLAGAVGVGITWLAVRRPAAGEIRADDALRVRSARVALGLTMATIGFLYGGNASDRGIGLFLAGVVLVAGLVCWSVVVRRRPRERRPATA